MAYLSKISSMNGFCDDGLVLTEPDAQGNNVFFNNSMNHQFLDHLRGEATAMVNFIHEHTDSDLKLLSKSKLISLVMYDQDQYDIVCDFVEKQQMLLKLDKLDLGE